MKLLSILTESIKEQAGVGLWGQDPRQKDTPIGRDYTKGGEPTFKKEPEKINGIQIGEGQKELILKTNTYIHHQVEKGHLLVREIINLIWVMIIQ